MDMNGDNNDDMDVAVPLPPQLSAVDSALRKLQSHEFITEDDVIQNFGNTLVWNLVRETCKWTEEEDDAMKQRMAQSLLQAEVVTPKSNKRPKSDTGQQPPSPGDKLDNIVFGKETDDGKTLLQNVMDVYDMVLRQIVIPVSPIKAPQLGCFIAKKFAHTSNRIDPRIECEALQTTPAGRDLSRKLLEAKGDDFILLGPSGCGKTTAIFDAAQKQYCVLFTAVKAEMEDNELKQYSDPGAVDLSFQNLVREVNLILADSSKTDFQKNDRCYYMIKTFIVSRLLVLYAFDHKISQFAIASNRKLLWLAFQLSEDMHRLAIALFNRLISRKIETIEAIRYELEKELEFFYALDEAQTAYAISRNPLWKSTSNTKTELRGIGCPMLRVLTGKGKSVVVAGTALSLGAAESCQSDLGKQQAVRTFDNFPLIDSLEEVASKLKHALNVDDGDLSQVPNLGKLVGRGRLLGGVFAALSVVINENPDSERDKPSYLEQAINQQYDSMLRRLEQRIENEFLVDDKLLNGRVLLPSIKCLAIAALWGTEVSIPLNEMNVDLLDIGLCPVKTGSHGCFILNEELARHAILNVARKHHAFEEAFESAVKFSNGTAASHSTEPLFVTCLMSKCSEDSGITVRDFLDELFDNNQTSCLPEWVDQCKFVVAGSYSRRNYLTNHIQSDVDFVQAALGEGQNRNFLLSPSTVKRPDFEAVMDAGDRTLWWLSVSIKLFQRGFDDDDGSDLISTQPSMFYCKRDGTANKNCKNLRARWDELLSSEQYKPIFSRCLRIHFCLKDVNKTKHGSTQRLFVDDKDGSIVAYITKDNARPFLGEEVSNLMQEYGYL